MHSSGGGRPGRGFHGALRRRRRLLRAFRLMRDSITPLTKAFLRTGIIFSCTLFIFASLYNLAEQIEYNFLTNAGDEPPLEADFGAAVYLGIVTLGTIGYGDLHPSTWVGKFLLVGLVILAVFAIPLEIQVIGGACG